MIDDLITHKKTRLNGEYVERVAQHAAAMLREGIPVALPYEPGNMTRYELVLTPMNAVAEQPATWPVAHDCAREHCVCISLVGEHRKAITLPILDPQFWLHHSYVAEKLGVTEGDALALLVLFREIATS